MIKYGQNLTEEDALAELKRISEESAVTLPQLDLLDLNTTE